MSCKACFWMDRVKGIKFPGMIPFLLNSATDKLLKADFDHYRALKRPHPFMINQDLGHLVPFEHEEFEQWTKSLQLGLRYEFEECFRFGLQIYTFHISYTARPGARWELGKTPCTLLMNM